MTVPVRPLASATRRAGVPDAPDQSGTLPSPFAGRGPGLMRVTMSPGLRVRLGEVVVGLECQRAGRWCDRQLLRLAEHRDSLGADEVGPQCIDVDDGAVERMVDRLAGDGELFALRQDAGAL